MVGLLAKKETGSCFPSIGKSAPNPEQLLQLTTRAKQKDTFDVVSSGDIHDCRFVLFRNHYMILSVSIAPVNISCLETTSFGFDAYNR